MTEKEFKDEIIKVMAKEWGEKLSEQYEVADWTMYPMDEDGDPDFDKEEFNIAKEAPFWLDEYFAVSGSEPCMFGVSQNYWGLPCFKTVENGSEKAEEFYVYLGKENDSWDDIIVSPYIFGSELENVGKKINKELWENFCTKTDLNYYGDEYSRTRLFFLGE